MLPQDPHGQRLAAEPRAGRFRFPSTHRPNGVSRPLLTTAGLHRGPFPLAPQHALSGAFFIN